MAKPGPVGKTDEDRVRRNKTSEDGLVTQTFSLDDAVKIPKGTFVTDVIQDLWNALTISVNVQFYEPTDWAYAKLTLTMWDKVLEAGGIPAAMMLASLDSMATKLLLTEGDRRRLKIEVQRGAVKAETGPSASDFYRDQFEKQGLSAVKDVV